MFPVYFVTYLPGCSWRINPLDQVRITKHNGIAALLCLQPQDAHTTEDATNLYSGDVSVREAPRYLSGPQGDNFSIRELPPESSQPIQDVTNDH